MSSADDLSAASSCDTNDPAWHLLLALEHLSTFQFQSGRWLADLAPEKLTHDEAQARVQAKERQFARKTIEKLMPKIADLKDGKAERRLTIHEATIVADCRKGLGQLLGLQPRFVTTDAVFNKYEELAQTEHV